MAVLEVDAGTDGNRLQEGDPDGEGDVESGLGNGQRRMNSRRRRNARMWLGRVAVWLWPTAIRNTIASSSAPAHVLPGHSFPISASAIETIRYKTYGLRSRRRVAIKPRAGDLLDGSRNLDHMSDDAEDGLVRSSNEFEFDSEEGYEVDEMEEYGMM
ncbi:hypothetical protein QFC20_006013 [Naganishia adeliensis]|uniref:Uncharacterized protein n=1 Tax=Naganishia adeliensis TaxID=92952 RepID=A0ACC2VG11_9TREE|nr:hypothetical protein QFC20_006013 [Naganishia adeliensis]